jgi:hypothetical protein
MIAAAYKFNSKQWADKVLDMITQRQSRDLLLWRQLLALAIYAPHLWDRWGLIDRMERQNFGPYGDKEALFAWTGALAARWDHQFAHECFSQAVDSLHADAPFLITTIAMKLNECPKKFDIADYLRVLAIATTRWGDPDDKAAVDWAATRYVVGYINGVSVPYFEHVLDQGTCGPSDPPALV